MKKEKKGTELLKLISILSDNDTIYLIDVSDLNSNQISILRKNFYEYNIQMRVVKNTLLKKALENIKNKKLDSFFSILNGNTSVLACDSNLGSIPSKIIRNFHISEKLEKPYLKGAYIEESFYFGNKDLDVLINIKSKKDLIIDIFKMLQSPMEQVILSIKYGKNQIFRILKTLSISKNKRVF